MVPRLYPKGRKSAKTLSHALILNSVFEFRSVLAVNKHMGAMVRQVRFGRIVHTGQFSRFHNHVGRPGGEAADVFCNGTTKQADFLRKIADVGA